jgi:hypothetical protein
LDACTPVVSLHGEKNKTYLVTGENDCSIEGEEDHLGLSLPYDM